MQYIGEHGIVRSRDIEAIGLPRQYLVRLHRQGKLNRPARGIYTLPDADVTAHHSYAEVIKRVPQGYCLPAFGACLSRDHNAEPCFGLDRSLQRGKNACSRFAFAHDRSAVRAITHRGNRQTSGGGRHSPRLFSREDRRRLFQISEQNRTRRRNRSPKGLSSPEKGQRQRNLPLRQSLPGQ